MVARRAIPDAAGRARVRPFRRLALGPLLLGLLAGCGGGAAPVSPEFEELVAAEIEFSNAVAAKGISAAFLEYLDDDGVVFQPGPVSGREWHSTVQSPIGAVLVWRPRLAAVSSSGDLGFTTGPWAYRHAASAAPSAFGNYVSVWRKRGGRWRLALDLGITHEPSGPDPESLPPVLPLSLGPGEAELESDASMSVEEAERALQGRFASGQPVAEMLDPAVRVFRDRTLPDSGRAAFDMLPRTAALLSWKTYGAGQSLAGDLGYTYGTFGAAAGYASDALNGNFVRIWTRDDAGQWVVALDMLSLHPPVPVAIR